MISDWQAITCWLLPLGQLNRVGVSLMVPSSSGCLIGRIGEATSLCGDSMHISDMQQQASDAEWAARSPSSLSRCMSPQFPLPTASGDWD